MYAIRSYYVARAVAASAIPVISAVGHQRLGGGRPGRRDGRQDPAARGEDLKVVGASLPELDLTSYNFV